MMTNDSLLFIHWLTDSNWPYTGNLTSLNHTAQYKNLLRRSHITTANSTSLWPVCTKMTAPKDFHRIRRPHHTHSIYANHCSTWSAVVWSRSVCLSVLLGIWVSSEKIAKSAKMQTHTGPKKGKGSPYSITKCGFRSWSHFFAVSLQVT